MLFNIYQSSPLHCTRVKLLLLLIKKNYNVFRFKVCICIIVIFIAHCLNYLPDSRTPSAWPLWSPSPQLIFQMQCGTFPHIQEIRRHLPFTHFQNVRRSPSSGHVTHFTNKKVLYRIRTYTLIPKDMCSLTLRNCVSDERINITFIM